MHSNRKWLEESKKMANYLTSDDDLVKDLTLNDF